MLRFSWNSFIYCNVIFVVSFMNFQTNWIFYGFQSATNNTAREERIKMNEKQKVSVLQRRFYRWKMDLYTHKKHTHIQNYKENMSKLILKLWNKSIWLKFAIFFLVYRHLHCCCCSYFAFSFHFVIMLMLGLVWTDLWSWVRSLTVYITFLSSYFFLFCCNVMCKCIAILSLVVPLFFSV